MADSAVWAAAKPFLTGSMAGSFATVCIQPMDMVKVRIQVTAAEGNAQGPVTIARNMIANEGFFSLYSGLSAGITRQVIYTGSRLGLYDIFTDMARDKETGKLGFAQTAGCGLAAGGIAALIGNPADLSLIRMQTDSMAPKAQQVGYRHVGHAMSSIVAEAGPAGLLKGCVPTSIRAMGLNLGMLAGNSFAKDTLSSATGMKKSDGVIVFGASAIAGFLASAFSLPFDYVKTQMQKQKPDANGKLQYSSSMNCVTQTLKKGGPLQFYAGFPTYYFRIAPHAMITLLAQDQVKKMWKACGL